MFKPEIRSILFSFEETNGDESDSSSDEESITKGRPSLNGVWETPVRPATISNNTDDDIRNDIENDIDDKNAVNDKDAVVLERWYHDDTRRGGLSSGECHCGSPGRSTSNGRPIRSPCFSSARP